MRSRRARSSRGRDYAYDPLTTDRHRHPTGDRGVAADSHQRHAAGARRDDRAHEGHHDPARPHQSRARSAGWYSSGARSGPVEGSRARLCHRHPARREGGTHADRRVRHDRARRADPGTLPPHRRAGGRKGPGPSQEHHPAHGLSRVSHHRHEEPVPRRAARDRQGAAAGPGGGGPPPPGAPAPAPSAARPPPRGGAGGENPPRAHPSPTPPPPLSLPHPPTKRTPGPGGARPARGGGGGGGGGGAAGGGPPPPPPPRRSALS